MKSLLFFAVTILSLNSFAEISKTLECKPFSGYSNPLGNLTLETENENYLINAAVGNEWKIGWSESECEDDTNIVFAKSEYEELLSGKRKSAAMSYEHESPDVLIKAAFNCTVKGE